MIQNNEREACNESRKSIKINDQKGLHQEVAFTKQQKLSTLKVGSKATITQINMIDKRVKSHLLAMGLTRGTEVMMKQTAPMGDPVTITLRGYDLTLRKEELAQIYGVRK